MPSVSLLYEFVVFDQSNAPLLTVTSVRAGTNPYIAEPPRGDGLEVDPIRGSVRTGAYTLTVTDPLLSGTSRLVTSVLSETTSGAPRMQLLSRTARVSQSTDGGVTWTPLIVGFVLGVRLVDAITYEFSIGDTRRIEQTRIVFDTDDPAYFPIRGTRFGGPIVGGNIGVVPSRQGGLFVVREVAGQRVGLDFLTGVGPDGRGTNLWRQFLGTKPGPTYEVNALDEWAEPYFSIVENNPNRYLFPRLRYRVASLLSGAEIGRFVPIAPPNTLLSGPVKLTGRGGVANERHIYADWTATAPAVGTAVWVSLLTFEVSEECPLYVSDHPVNIVRKLYKQAGIAINENSFDVLEDLSGYDLRVTLRITEATSMLRFIESALAGPFGIGLRVNNAGEIEAFSTRIKTTTLPTVTVDTTDLTDDVLPVFELDESTVVNTVTLESLELVPVVNGPRNLTGLELSELPPSGFWISKNVVESVNVDASVFGTREIRYTVPGMIHTANTFQPNTEAFADALAREIWDRYGRGVQAGELRVRRGASANSVQVGDEIYVQPAHLPNANKRLGDDPSVGARIMQVVRRTESPDHIDLYVLDSGTAAQPSIAPTISIAASGSFPATVAAFTITNAATLSAAGLSVAVEWTVSTTTPTVDGSMFARYDAGNIPTGAVNLPSVVPGSTVWVRARSEVFGQRPSAFTAWQNVALSALATPSTLAAGDITENGARLTWINTNSDLRLRVWAAPSASTNVAAAQWIVADLLAGSTTATLTTLQGPGVSYTARVAYLTPEGTEGPAATVTFTTGTNALTAPRPAGLQVLSTTEASESTQFRTGVPIAVWAADPAFQLVLERAPDVAGVPGTFAEIAVVPGATTMYVDTLPVTGDVYWYRWIHRAGGYLDSAATCAQDGVASGVPDNFARPDLIVPDVLVSIEETATTGTVRFDITDPQCRVVRVRARTRTDGVTWGPFVTLTPPYVVTDTIPATGFLEVQYEVSGYDGAGALVTFASGIEYFDRGTSPDITLISGSFSITGQFFLNINADSDSASIKYATSTTGFPTLATVQAETAVAGRVINATLGGPFTSGAVVYVSALAYSGAGGTGEESPISQASFTRDTLDLRVDEELSETATVGTATIYVYDPTERVANFERRTKVGHAAWSAYSFATNVGSPTDKIYVQTVPLVEKVPSLIEYRLIGTTQNGVANQVLLSNVITFAMGEKPFIPDLFVTVREDGTVDAVVQGDSDTASTRVGFSTTSQAAADSAAAVATAVNGRTRTALNVGSLALGEKGFVSALAYSGAGGTGEVSEMAQAEIVRSNVAVGRTVRWNTAGVFQPQFPSTTSVARDLFGYIPMINLSGTATHYATLPVPTGATLQSVTIRIDLFLTFAGTGSVTMRLYRLENDGVSTQLGSDQVINTNGTQSLTVGSLSDSVTAARSYVVELEADSSDVSNLATAFYADVGYLSPNITVNL